MKPDSMMVEPDMIAEAYLKVVETDDEAIFDELKTREPVLASWLEQEMLGIAGKMGLSATPRQVIAGSFSDFASILLTALEATRTGHYAVWKDMLIGTPWEATCGEDAVNESTAAAPQEDPDRDGESDSAA